MGAIRNLYEISCRFPVKLPRAIGKGYVIRFVADVFLTKIFLIIENDCCIYDSDVL